MRDLSCFPAIYLHTTPVDFRKSINGLGAIVESELKMNSFDKALFVFCCQRRKKIKILYWDETGFALWYKKLEQDLFPWPKDNTEDVLEIDAKRLRWLLDGINFWNLKPHQVKNYKKMN
jgi:transposase